MWVCSETIDREKAALNEIIDLVKNISAINFMPGFHSKNERKFTARSLLGYDFITNKQNTFVVGNGKHET